MSDCLLGIGANLGDRRGQIRAAVERLRQCEQVEAVSVSSLIATAPIGGPQGQGEFLNAAIRLQTSASPHQLLAIVHAIESELGRDRQVHWDARSIDIDVLLYDDWVVEDPHLTIPHPWMVVRRFVLQPAVEVAADMRHPILNRTVGQLYHHLRTADPRFAVVGINSYADWLPFVASAASRLKSEFDVCPISPPEFPLPVPSSARHVEWVEAHLRKLQEGRWTEACSARSLRIAGFWLPEIIQRAACQLDASAASRMRTRLQSVEAEWFRSKLVLIVDAGTSSGSETESVPRAAPSETAVKPESVGSLVRRYGDPFLRLADHRELSWVDRAIAAIQMMQS